MDKVVHFEDRKLALNYLTGDRKAGRVLYENIHMPLLHFIKKQLSCQPAVRLQLTQI